MLDLCAGADLQDIFDAFTIALGTACAANGDRDGALKIATLMACRIIGHTGLVSDRVRRREKELI